MNGNVVIRAEALGKKYVIGHESERERYTALRDVVGRRAKTILRTTCDMLRGRAMVAGDTTEEFWALKDINFEIKRGEVVGIIGHNGAGKSTLLKILSRITEPTEGRVTIRGRVASLLEVGTGFHPELTGRENIYLNGAILGMTRAEIHRKFDEIVAFAEVEKFLDTPVKRYSSGMYVRLAFAVAAHLEPEILVVDEVLAVGDAEFQKKCIGKMSEEAGGGRTVLFVSHNMVAIETLCPRSLCLAGGMLIHDARSRDVIAAFVERRRISSRGAQVQSQVIDTSLTIEAVHIENVIHSGESLSVKLEFGADQAGHLRECALLFYSAKGERIATVDLRGCKAVPLQYKPGKFRINVRVASVPLVEGNYALGIYLVTSRFSGNLLDLAELTVVTPAALGEFTGYPADVRGFLMLDAEATVSVAQAAVGEP
jgi:lipopolysaccharide transport system ATP-binding protein